MEGQKQQVLNQIFLHFQLQREIRAELPDKKLNIPKPKRQ